MMPPKMPAMIIPDVLKDGGGNVKFFFFFMIRRINCCCVMMRCFLTKR